MGYGTASFDLPSSSESVYARARTAGWLFRLLPRTRSLDSEFFTCLQWVAGDLRHLLVDVEKRAARIRRVSGIVRAREALREIVKSREERLPGELDDLFEEHPCLRNSILEVVQSECRAIGSLGDCMGGAYGTARMRLEQTFGLSADSLVFCEFLFINQNFSVVESYFEDNVGIGNYEKRQLFAEMLDMTPQALQTCIRELTRCGLIESDFRIFRLNDNLLPFWTEESDSLEEQFARPVEGKTLPLENFHLAREDVEHVRKLLEREGEAPVHILLYGPPGTGKTSFAHSLIEACGIRAWAVRGTLDDDERDRRMSMSACLHLASRHRRALVLVDEAERLLDTGIHFGVRSSSKSGLNSLLEEPCRRMIWIANSVDDIDPAVRRRFSFSIHFEGLGIRERVGVWRQILRDQGVLDRIDEGEIRFLTEAYPVEVAVIQNAVSQAVLLHTERDAFLAALKRILLAQTTLHNNGKRPRNRVTPTEEFVREGVCLEGDTDRLLERCRRIDAAMREGKPLRPGIGTMLFYGPPGTGKTALARHIAKTLGRECLSRRASDLLSPYVGMSEQQVAAAFAKAEREGAVLVLDEADSFLFARDGGLRSWENSLVNEFLAALEECRGFCICTTNRRLDMDAAVMRRFSHKIAFGHAGQEQVLKLYAGLLAPLCTTPMTEGERARLLDLRGLVPGDFHAVRCQFDPLFADTPEVSHERLVAALAAELRLKTERVRPVGFCH